MSLTGTTPRSCGSTPQRDDPWTGVGGLRKGNRMEQDRSRDTAERDQERTDDIVDEQRDKLESTEITDE